MAKRKSKASPRSAERSAKMTAAQKSTQFKRLDYIYNADKYLSGNKWDKDKLLKDALRVAKATNMRLLRLEKAGYTNAPTYQGALNAMQGKYTKDGAVSFGAVKDGKPRYASAGQIMKMTVEELRRLLYAASKTQTAVTSTPSGVEYVYNKGAQNIMKMAAAAGINLSLNQILPLYRNAALKAAMKTFGYKAVLQIINEKMGDYEDDADYMSEFEAIGEEVASATRKLMDSGVLNVATLREELGLKASDVIENKKTGRYRQTF